MSYFNRSQTTRSPSAQKDPLPQSPVYPNSSYPSPPTSPYNNPSQRPYVQTTTTTMAQSNATSTARTEQTKETTRGTTIQTVITGGDDAMKVIAAAREKLTLHVNSLRQDHLMGLEWVMKELEGFRLIYETAISQYQTEVSKYKQEIETKTSELKTSQTRIVALGEEKERAVKEATSKLSGEKQVEWKVLLEKEKAALTKSLTATHEQEMAKLRAAHDAETTKSNYTLAKLRTDSDAEKTRAIEEIKTQLRTEFASEKTKLLNSSRITLDFHSQSTVARDIMKTLIDKGAVHVDSLNKLNTESESVQINGSAMQTTYTVRGPEVQTNRVVTSRGSTYSRQ